MNAAVEIRPYEDLRRLFEEDNLCLFTGVDPRSRAKVLIWLWNGPLEASSLAGFNADRHCYFAPVLDHGIDSGLSYAVQPFPDGKLLAECLKKGPLPERAVFTIASRVASALRVLHHEGKVHGNLSPWSMFVSRNEEVRVLGLGLPRVGFGCPSPEQLQNRDPMPASDVFSLGAILYECLTGFPPFPGRDRTEMVRGVVYSPPARMRAARPRLSPGVEALVLRCLEKNPADRYPDANAFLEGLLDLLIKSPRVFEPFRPKRQRLRPWLVSAGCLLAALVSFGVWYRANLSEGIPFAQDAGQYTGWQRLAVMEPRYVGDASARSYLVQGIVDEIVSVLSANTTLEVISTLSTRVYTDSDKSAEQIALELSADGLVESTLIDKGEQVKLHIRLVDGKSGLYLWDDQLVLSEADVIEVQNKVEGVLYAELRPVWMHTQEHLHRASTVEAYTLFLEGRRLYHIYGREENPLAVTKFEEALERDPYFAPAWAALARAYSNVVNVEETMDRSWLDKADEAAERAIELGPQLPDGYYSRGMNAYVRYIYFGSAERAKAEKDIDKALKLSPDFPDALLAKAFILTSQSIDLNDKSMAEAALRLYERALILQPNLPNSEANYARALAWIGKKEQARKRLEQALQVFPRADPLHVTLADILLLEGNAEEAAYVTQAAVESGILTSRVHEARLAAFCAAAGQLLKARQTLNGIQGRSTYYEDFFIASAWAGTGDEQKAVQSLRAWQNKMSYRKEQQGLFRWWLRSDPNFISLREKGALDQFLTAEREYGSALRPAALSR